MLVLVTNGALLLVQLYDAARFFVFMLGYEPLSRKIFVMVVLVGNGAFLSGPTI